MQVPTWLKVTLSIVFLIAGTVAAVWLAGALFFVLSKKNPFGITHFNTWWEYWQYYHQYPVVSKHLKAAAVGAAMIGYGVPIFVLLAMFNYERALHGEARFANPQEIVESGLLGTKDDIGKPGIIVGKWRRKYLCLYGQQFVLLGAPTRSGKGVGIVIPNLLNFPHSVVVLDIKQENFEKTAGFRKKHGQKVYLFNPFAEDFRTDRYNPLGYVRDGNFRVGDLTAIGKVFYPGNSGKADKDNMWDDQALNLFVGLGLFLCETPSLPRTLGEMLRQSSGKGKSVKAHLKGIIESRNFREIESLDVTTGEVTTELVPILDWDGQGEPPLSPECVDSLNRFMATSDNTLSSIVATFNAPLSIWTSPIVDAATSANDFDLRDVRKQRMSIYVGITPDHLQEAGLLVNLFFSQLVNLNTKELPEKNPALKYQCLLLMDEFTSIGRVNIIAKAVSYMAGYNLRLLPIIQSMSQLSSVYGYEDARTFATNHAVTILYAPREQQDAEEYSKMLGTETVKATSRSIQGGRSEGRNISDHGRALLLPQEIKEIGQWKEIVILENTKPIFCEKIKYFKDKTFTSRIIDAPPVPLLDLDNHAAIVQARVRPATVADVEAGVDLNKLAVDMTNVVVEGNQADMSPEQVSEFVDDFFDSLDAADDFAIDEDGAGARPSDDELAALDEEFAEGKDDSTLLDRFEITINSVAAEAGNTISPEPEYSPEPEPEHSPEPENEPEFIEEFDELPEISDDWTEPETVMEDDDALIDLTILDTPTKGGNYGPTA